MLIKVAELGKQSLEKGQIVKIPANVYYFEQLVIIESNNGLKV